MKLAGWAIGIVTLVGAAIYTGVSIGRWEWNRALFFAIVFVAAEIGLAAAMILHRLDRSDTADDPDRRQRAVVRDARSRHRRFEWLRQDHTEIVNRSGVFITLLVGGGVVLSGLAWVLDKVAGSTTDRRREAQLARDLDTIRYPDGGVLVEDSVVLARSPRRDDEAPIRKLLGRDR